MFDNLLRGLRVIDLTQNVAGPFCTQILGDLGADVIKVERPGSGDDTRAWRPPEIGGESSTFLALNRNKRSICIDLGQESGVRIVRQLAENADVVIHSMKPGSAEARGFGPEELQAINPKLIYCAISAFGKSGPLAQLPGYDPLMQAFSGIMSVTGNEGDDPVRVSVSLIDMGTGLWAALGVICALLARQSTGRGIQVNASLLETGLSWMTIFFANYLASEKLPRKMGSAMSMTAPYELFRAEDGYVFIAAANDRLFAKVCDVLQCPELRSDPRFVTNADRVRNREQLHSDLEARTELRTVRDLTSGLRAAGAPCSELNDIAEVIRHEQVQSLGMVAPLPTTSAPELKTVMLPLMTNGKRVGRLSPPPQLGADTADILSELGYSSLDQARLVAGGAIA